MAQSNVFWLGDSFGSGGSAVIVHNAMGITDMAAWGRRPAATRARPGRAAPCATACPRRRPARTRPRPAPTRRCTWHGRSWIR
ncbi:NAD-glutamate dehydrogenase domain-containing protein [Nocardia abscessus]|uniref:NAD-glutamate dehydrogenase domain-containing protein n=1 Tax=Nocardia abscessus TaxID=120957 RepID=UPI003CC80184